MTRKLYHTPLSPFCRKIRMALKEKNLDFELLQENPADKSLSIFALDPAGEIPALVEAGGALISGAYAIGEYLEEAYPETTLLGRSVAERAEVRRLAGWFDHKFDYEVTQAILFEKVFKHYLRGGEPNSTAIRQGKHNLLYHLDYIGHLAGIRYFLAGDTLTMADLAAAAHLSALDYLGDVPWDYNPAARNWYALIKSRPSLRCILGERVRGVRPPAYYENPDF
jgi:glutathione S-transferase